MTMVALNGSKCDNDTVVIQQPSTVAFQCMYEINGATTQYTWSTDLVPDPLVGMTSTVAYAPIPSGTHYVTCAANIDISDRVPVIPPGEVCECNEMRTFVVPVVGT